MLDDFMMNLLRCPVTRETLHLNTSGKLENESGTEQFDVVHGIPDFRRFDPPYLTRAEEAEAADRMADAMERMTYDDLIVHLERDIYPNTRSEEQITKSIAHRRTLVERSPSRLDWLLDATDNTAKPHGLTLDLGCGSGEATAALKQRGAARVIGVDISLIELMLAKKLLQEHDQPAYLIASAAEALPFADDSLDFIYSPDVIEHVSDQHLYLQEARRALQNEGDFLLNSPNRYSAVCPEPHNGIWLFGYLPRALMSPASRLAGRGPYRGKRLVSLFELRRLVGASFNHYRIYSRKSNPTATSIAGRAFHATRALSEPAFAVVCDQHIIHAGPPNRNETPNSSNSVQ